jgi:hypothetical protein
VDIRKKTMAAMLVLRASDLEIVLDLRDGLGGLPQLLQTIGQAVDRPIRLRADKQI